MRSKGSEDHDGQHRSPMKQSNFIMKVPVRQGRGGGDDHEDGARSHHGNDEVLVDKPPKEKEEKKLTPHVALMQPILRFLQLLCENHNRDLQVTIQSNLSLATFKSTYVFYLLFFTIINKQFITIHTNLICYLV